MKGKNIHKNYPYPCMNVSNHHNKIKDKKIEKHK